MARSRRASACEMRDLRIRGGIALAGTFDQGDDLLFGERLGKHLPLLGAVDVQGGIVGDQLVQQQDSGRTGAGQRACGRRNANPCRGRAGAAAIP